MSALEIEQNSENQPYSFVFGMISTLGTADEQAEPTQGLKRTREEAFEAPPNDEAKKARVGLTLEEELAQKKNEAASLDKEIWKLEYIIQLKKKLSLNEDKLKSLNEKLKSVQEIKEVLNKNSKWLSGIHHTFSAGSAFYCQLSFYDVVENEFKSDMNKVNAKIDNIQEELDALMQSRAQ